MNELSIHINGKEVTRDDIYCFEYKGKSIFCGMEDYWEIGKKGKRGIIFIGGDWYECNEIKNCRKISFEEFDQLVAAKEKKEKGVVYTEDFIEGMYNDYVLRRFNKVRERVENKRIKKEIIETYFGYWTGEEGKLERIKKEIFTKDFIS